MYIFCIKMRRDNFSKEYLCLFYSKIFWDDDVGFVSEPAQDVG